MAAAAAETSRRGIAATASSTWVEAAGLTHGGERFAS